MKPTTAHERWLQERQDYFDIAQLQYEFFGNNSPTMWYCLFAWETPDIWNDPEYKTKKKNT